MSTQFRGVFLTSNSPSETARFYEMVAELPLEKIETDSGYSYWRVDTNDVQLAIHDASSFANYTHPVVSSSNLTHLYFRVEDVPTFMRHLETLSLSPYAVDNIVVTVTDPDGRKVMFGTA